MKKVDVPQVLISTAALFGIDLLNATLYDTDTEEKD